MATREVAGRKEIRGYDAVRNAARDFEQYSSDLIGDRHARDYRQLPLEVDPPRHTVLREALQPLFLSGAIKPKAPEFYRAARSVIDDINARGGGDVVSQVALPYVVRCLAIVYNRTQDFEEWLSWGPDVFAGGDPSSPTSGHSLAAGERVQTYLDRVLNEKNALPAEGPDDLDVWSFVSNLKIDDRPISHSEMYGVGNLLLAGGRDTLIKVICGLTWHLLSHPEDRLYLDEHRDAVPGAVAEMVRYLSPLKRMERVEPEQRRLPDEERDPSQYVLLSFLSANYDPAVWPDADRLDIRRERKPHLGFGFGRHACMGMKIAEHASAAFLGALLDDWPDWRLDGEPTLKWEQHADFQVIDNFLSIPIVTRGER